MSEHWTSSIETWHCGWSMQRWRWKTARLTTPATSGIEQSPSSQEPTSSGTTDINVSLNHVTELCPLVVMWGWMKPSLLHVVTVISEWTSTVWWTMGVFYLWKVQVYIHGGDVGEPSRLSAGVWTLDGMGARGTSVAFLHQLWAAL